MRKDEIIQRVLVGVSFYLVGCEKPYFFKWLRDTRSRSKGTVFRFPPHFATARQFSNVEYVTRSPHVQTKYGAHLGIQTLLVSNFVDLPILDREALLVGIIRYAQMYFDVPSAQLRLCRRAQLSERVI